MTDSGRDENFERMMDEYLKKHNLVLSANSTKIDTVNPVQRNYAKRREKNIGSEYKKMKERKGVMGMLADYINKDYIEDYENEFTKLKSSKNIENNEYNKKMDMPAKKGRKKKEVVKPVTDSNVPVVDKPVENKPVKKQRKRKVKVKDEKGVSFDINPVKKEEKYIPSPPIDIPKEPKKEDPQSIIPKQKTAAEEKKEKAQERKRLAAERKKMKEERKKSRTPEQQKKIDERMAKMRAKRLANKK